MKKTYSYLNTNLENLPGEEWKDIDGHEGSYQVSTHGRIKSFPKYTEIYIPSQQHTIRRWSKLCIRKQRVHTKLNTIVNMPYYECTISLQSESGEKTHLVHRLVYHAFIHPIDFEKDKLMVMHKNGDGLDNHFKNLMLGKRNVVSKTSYDRNRHISPFALMSQEEKKLMKSKALPKLCKQIVQYNRDGAIIKTFSSIKEASEETSTAVSNIVEVLKDRRKSAGGSIWKYMDRE